MAVTPQCAVSLQENDKALELSDNQRACIQRELRRILDTDLFRRSHRRSELLTYLVTQKIQGHDHTLKERSIGIEIFKRPPHYDTGADAIVRVAATELRSKLELHYAQCGYEPEVTIRVPVGSYAPQFEFKAPEGTCHRRRSSATKAEFVMFLLSVLVLMCSAVLVGWHGSQTLPAPLAWFWGPALKNSKTMDIVVGTTHLYEIASPQAGCDSVTTTRLQFLKQPRELSPGRRQDRPACGSFPLIPNTGMYVGTGATAAISYLTTTFNRVGMRVDVHMGQTPRSGKNTGNSLVLIGAFNNPETLRICEDLRFSFKEGREQVGIVEHGGGSGGWWVPKEQDRATLPADYGIVARLVTSRGLTVIIAGIEVFGTRASADFVSNPEAIGAIRESAPRNWAGRNFEVVLKKTLHAQNPAIESNLPQVVASHYW